jgi:predicted dehydrogenase
MLGCYCIDLCSWMFGCHPQRALLYSPTAEGHEVDFADVAVLEFDMDRLGYFDVGFSCARRNHCEIVGTVGTIDVTAAFASNLPSTVTLRTMSKPPTLLEFSPINTLLLQFEHFSSCILSSQAPAISLVESVQNAATLEMLRRSSE